MAAPARGGGLNLEEHRVGLTGYCYRMLGADAEDAVQETFLRAWQAADRFDPAKGSVRTWLHAIATNVCLDLLRAPQRRALATDLAAPAAPGQPLGPPLPPGAWVWPVADERVLDPADTVVARESVRLALVAALQHLPPRQRAVLVLRDVLCWRAAEVAQLLGTSVASVTSALQRARAALPAPPPVDAAPPADLLDRYRRAFEAHDVEALVALLAEDATMTMPPYTWWLRGRADIGAALAVADGPCVGARLLPTRANGGPAFGHYLADGEAFALVTLTVAGGRITGTSTHLDPGLLPAFGLPVRLGPMSSRASTRTNR